MIIRTLTTEAGYLINEYQYDNPEEAETLMQVLIKNKIRFEVLP